MLSGLSAGLTARNVITASVSAWRASSRISFQRVSCRYACLATSVGSQNSCKNSSRNINNFCSGSENDESKILKITAKILIGKYAPKRRVCRFEGLGQKGASKLLQV